MDNGNKKSPRRFPAVYEKVIPIALGIIIFCVVALLVIIAAVLSGAFPAL